MRIECYDYGIREVKISESSRKEERCPIEEAGKAIGDSLELKEIDITLSHSGCDDPVIEIFQGMSRNRSIELVKLRSDVVFEPKIDVFQVLIPFFEHNDNLRCMELYRARSWTLKHLPAALSACKNSQLQRINMINIKASDKIIVSFFGSLSTLHFLTELCVEKTNIGVQGCEAFCNLLTNSESKLQRLEICEAQLDDERVICLGSALAVNKTVKYLDLDMEEQNTLTSEGWRGLSQCLRNPDSALETLKFRDNCYYDEEVVAEGLAAMLRALEGNSTLKELDIGYDSDDALFIDAWVWELFDRVLCDKTSIINTYFSNHTLCEFMIYGYWRDFRDEGGYSEVQDHVDYLLSVNENDNKGGVARQKILEHHFGDERADNINIFSSMPESVLVHAIEWIGRDELGRSLMYEFVRTFPHLFGNRIVPDDAAGKKRKRGMLGHLF